MTTLHFVQLSDIHIGLGENHHEVLCAQSADFLAKVVADVNRLPNLDFLLITGDTADTAQPQEFARFQAIMSGLIKPYYLVPGNHDRKATGWSRQEFAQRFNPQIALRPTDPQAQVGYWSMAVHPKIQLIGLDSIRDEDWGGIISPPQFSWLKNELDSHTDKLVILSVHHPFHSLAPVDNHPTYRLFVCDNGAEMLSLLDQYPQVKLVLTGHHHQTKTDWLGARLHLACPGLGVFPCAYRTIRLHQQADKTWQIDWQTHMAVDEATLAEARLISLKAWQEAGFDYDFAEAHMQLAWGNDFDRTGQASYGR